MVGVGVWTVWDSGFAQAVVVCFDGFFVDVSGLEEPGLQLLKWISSLSTPEKVLPQFGQGLRDLPGQILKSKGTLCKPRRPVRFVVRWT